jgi:nitrite reductase/ring-hydroxylating ferredoxin subunit
MHENSMKEELEQQSACEQCALYGTRRDFLKFSAAAALGLHSLSALSLSSATVTYPIPAQDGAHIDRENEVILVRWQNAIYAFALSCPHQRTALRWLEADHRFQCSKHKSKYQPDGTFISGRATRGMDRFSLYHEGNTVIVDLNICTSKTWMRRAGMQQ